MEVIHQFSLTIPIKTFIPYIELVKSMTKINKHNNYRDGLIPVAEQDRLPQHLVKAHQNLMKEQTINVTLNVQVMEDGTIRC